MMDSDTKLTRRELRAQKLRDFCAHVLGTKTLKEAAERTGITPRSATRWLQSEAFRDTFVAMMRPDFSALGELAKSLSVPALLACGRVVADPDASPTAVAACARLIQEAALEYDAHSHAMGDIHQLRVDAGLET